MRQRITFSMCNHRRLYLGLMEPRALISPVLERGPGSATEHAAKEPGWKAALAHRLITPYVEAASLVTTYDAR